MVANIAYGTVTNSWGRVERYIIPRIGDRSLMVLWGQTSITSAYNKILGAHAENTPDALVLLHDDLEIIDPAFEEKITQLVSDPDVAIIGVAGGRGVSSLAWWEAPERYGYQLTDSGPLTLGPREGDVDSLEGSLLVLTPWTIRNLRYDERLTGFHCCDEICISAARAGKRVVVANIDTHHHTVLGFKSEAAQSEWYGNDTLYRERWNL